MIEKWNYWKSPPQTLQSLLFRQAFSCHSLYPCPSPLIPVMFPSASPSHASISPVYFLLSHLLVDVILFIHSHSCRPSALLLFLVCPYQQDCQSYIFWSLNFKFLSTEERFESHRLSWSWYCKTQNSLTIIVTFGFYISSMVKVD